MAKRLGIIAGKGQLPVLVSQMAVAKGFEPVIICLDGRSSTEFYSEQVADFQVTDIEAIITHFKSHACENIVMIGKVERPTLHPEMVLDETASAIIKEYLPKGDDAILRAILAVMQQAGLQIMPVSLLAPTHKLPQHYDNAIEVANYQESLSLAMHAHEQVSSLDMGQSLIVQGQRIIAIEAAEGTDAMIQRAAEHASSDDVLLFLKASKINQNKLLDPPVFGPDTFQQCLKAGIKVIVLEAEHCLLAMPFDDLASLCEQHHIRLVSVSFDKSHIS